MTQRNDLVSRWGNPRDNQLSAEKSASAYKKKSEVLDEEKDVHRSFRFRCSLIKALNLIGHEVSDAQLYLDGYDNLRLSSGRVSFNFVQKPTSEGELPVVDVYFNGYGSRWGRLRHYAVTSVTIWFKDREQFEQYVTAVILPAEKPAVMPPHVKKVVKSGDSLTPFLVGLGLGSILN